MDKDSGFSTILWLRVTLPFLFVKVDPFFFEFESGKLKATWLGKMINGSKAKNEIAMPKLNYLIGSLKIHIKILPLSY